MTRPSAASAFLLFALLPSLGGCMCFRPFGAGPTSDWSRGAERAVSLEEPLTLGPARTAMLEAVVAGAEDLPDFDDRLMTLEFAAELYVDAGDRDGQRETAMVVLETLEMMEDEDLAYESVDSYAPLFWGAGLCDEVVGGAEANLETGYGGDYLALAIETCAHDGELDTALGLLKDLHDEEARATAILGMLDAVADLSADDLPEGLLDRLVVRARSIDERDTRRLVLVALTAAYGRSGDQQMMERLVSRVRMGLAELDPGARAQVHVQLSRAYLTAKRTKDAGLLFGEALAAAVESGADANAYLPLVGLAVELGKADAVVAAQREWTEPEQRVALLTTVAGAVSRARKGGGAAAAASIWKRAEAVARAADEPAPRLSLLHAIVTAAAQAGESDRARSTLADAHRQLSAIEDEGVAEQAVGLLMSGAMRARDLKRLDALAAEHPELTNDAQRLMAIRLLTSLDDARGAERRVADLEEVGVRALADALIAGVESRRGDRREAAQRYRRVYDLARASWVDSWGGEALVEIAGWHARSGRPDIAVEVLLDLEGATTRLDALLELVLEVGPADPVTPRLELMLDALEGRVLRDAEREAELSDLEGELDDMDCEDYCEDDCGWNEPDYEGCEEDFDMCLEDCDVLYDDCDSGCADDDVDCGDECIEEADACEMGCEDDFDLCLDEDGGHFHDHDDDDHDDDDDDDDTLENIFGSSGSGKAKTIRARIRRRDARAHARRVAIGRRALWSARRAVRSGAPAATVATHETPANPAKADTSSAAGPAAVAAPVGVAAAAAVAAVAGDRLGAGVEGRGARGEGRGVGAAPDGGGGPAQAAAALGPAR